MAHTIYYFAGFEEGGFESMIASGCTIETTITSFSRKSAKLLANGTTPYLFMYGSGLNAAGQWYDPNANPSAIMAFHMYIAALPGGGQYFYLFRHSDATIQRYGSMRIRSDGKIDILSEGAPGGTDVTSTQALTTDKWYVVTIFATSGSNIRIIVRDRDTEVTVLDLTGTQANSSNRYTYIGCGWASYGTVYIDNFVWEEGASIDDPVNLLSTKYAVNMQLPTGSGYYNQSTGTYADVDDAPHDGDTTYRDYNGAHADTHTVQSTSTFPVAPAQIHGVIGLTVARTTANLTNGNIRIRSGGVDGNCSEAPDYTTSYEIRRFLWLTDPATSAAWLVSAVDSLQVGQAWSRGWYPRLTACRTEVLYSTTPLERIPRMSYIINALDERARVGNHLGENIGYDEIRANRWTRYLDMLLPSSDAREDFWLSDDLFYNEGVIYKQDGESSSVSIASSPDDFVERLVTKIALSAGGSI